MPQGTRRWTRDEVMIAMNLYCRIPFGHQHARAPEVIELAHALDRTPSSVAMKLNNLTSLDPDERARGVRGLPGASALDRDVWNAFHANWEEMSAESESLYDRMLGRTSDLPESIAPASGEHDVLPQPPSGPTEAVRSVRVRLSQAFFRRAVLTAYDWRCCISGNPVPGLLEAAHIARWSDAPGDRGNPRNGLCLSRLHHAAFDQGLISVDDARRLLVSRRLKDHLPNESVEANFTRFEGEPLRSPERFPPAREFLAQHRETVFVA